MELDINLPGFNFFEEGNVWTGSLTKDRNAGIMLRARIVPDKENNKLSAMLWKNQDVCYERARDTEERDFPFSSDSMESLKDWFYTEFEGL